MVAARRMPYIEASGQRTANVHYAPSTCGLHDIYLKVVHHGLATPKVKAVDSIQVDCPDAADGGTPANPDGGASGDAGTGGDAGMGPGGGSGPSDDGGGCSVTPDAPAGGLGGWLAPFGMVLASLVARRKRKA
jgi:MYXO-CTERM domain-containing protein